MSLIDVALLGLIAILIATLVGIATFIVEYRPFDPRSHGPAGRHLLAMSWSLAALYAVSIVGAFLPLPLWLMIPVSYLILGAVCVVVWQRWLLLRKVRRMDAPDPVTSELNERGCD